MLLSMVRLAWESVLPIRRTSFSAISASCTKFATDKDSIYR